MVDSEGRKRWWVGGSLLLLLLTAGSSALWWRNMSAMPEVTIPAPKMPSPNAYDFYVQASQTIILPISAIDPIFDKANIPQEQWKARYPITKKEAWLQQNAITLKLIRQGFAYSCHAPSRRTGKSTADQLALSKNIRSIARLLVVESRVHGERKQWGAAACSVLGILRLGHDIAQGGAVLDFLYSAAINAMGTQELWTILPHLNASEARQTAQQLRNIIAKQSPVSNILSEEKYFGQAALIQIMREMPGTMASPIDTNGQFRFSAILKMLVTSRRTVFNNYTNYMDRLIRNSQQPYAKKSTTPALPNDIYSQIVAPVYKRFLWNYERAESKSSLLYVALILHAYNKEQHRYPQTLDELAPHYLKKIPPDPFGHGEPLRYKKTKDKYILYSIGPDGIDNDGQAIENVKISKKKRGRFISRPESKGDFVAGINY